MKTVLPALLLLVSAPAFSQYYYNDIIGTDAINAQMKAYRSNKVVQVTARGTDPTGAITNEFSETQEVKENGMLLKISHFSGLNKTVTYQRFNEAGKVISIIDSSADLTDITTYTYDAAGRVSRIRNENADTAQEFKQAETHDWRYDAAGKPTGMWRVINGNDSTEIRFMPDEHGNTGDERTYKRGHETGVIYYYYNDDQRLSDIVRYNTRLKKLLPDVMFEYDEQGNVAQRITTTSSLSLKYLIWRYVYDAKGLKTKEALFNSDKEMTGKIEYSYTFGQ